MMVHNSSTSIDLIIMKVVKGGRSERNELLNVPIKLHWNDDTCTLKKGSIIKNIGLHFTAVNERWEISLLKDVASMPEIEHSSSFDRDMFRRNLPLDYEEMSDTKISRFFGKMVEWGLMIKLGHNKYAIHKDNLSDFGNSE